MTHASEEVPIFGQRLQAMRLERKLTQVALGTLAGTTGVTVGRFENGSRRNPSLKLALRFAHALGCSLHYLAGESDDPER